MRHLGDVGELGHLGGRLLRSHVGRDVEAGHDLPELVELVDGEPELRAERLDVEDLRGAHGVGLAELDGRRLQLLILLVGAVDGLLYVGERRVDLHRRSDRCRADADHGRGEGAGEPVSNRLHAASETLDARAEGLDAGSELAEQGRRRPLLHDGVGERLLVAFELLLGHHYVGLQLRPLSLLLGRERVDVLHLLLGLSEEVELLLGRLDLPLVVLLLLCEELHVARIELERALDLAQVGGDAANLAPRLAKRARQAGGVHAELDGQPLVNVCHIRFSPGLTTRICLCPPASPDAPSAHRPLPRHRRTRCRCRR